MPENRAWRLQTVDTEAAFLVSLRYGGLGGRGKNPAPSMILANFNRRGSSIFAFFLKATFLVGVLSALISSHALADISPFANIPEEHLPLFSLAEIVPILIEAWLLVLIFKIRFLQSILVSFIANLLSYFVPLVLFRELGFLPALAPIGFFFFQPMNLAYIVMATIVLEFLVYLVAFHRFSMLRIVSAVILVNIISYPVFLVASFYWIWALGAIFAPVGTPVPVDIPPPGISG